MLASGGHAVGQARQHHPPTTHEGLSKLVNADVMQDRGAHTLGDRQSPVQFVDFVHYLRLIKFNRQIENFEALNFVLTVKF